LRTRARTGIAPGDWTTTLERAQSVGLTRSVSMTAGVAFAIVALLNGPGMAYVIVAILAGLAYSLVAMVSRRRRL
jgi:hypothetical protein